MGVETTLWLWVIVAGATDILFTYHGLSAGLIEVNPLGQLGLATFGVWSLAAGKVLALGVGALGWVYLDRHRFLVPVVFIGCWGLAALSNAVLIGAAA